MLDYAIVLKGDKGVGHLTAPKLNPSGNDLTNEKINMNSGKPSIYSREI